MTKDELEKLQGYFRKLFGNETITVRGRSLKADSAELFVGDEFVGVVFRDDEEGEVSYNLSMAILAYDLDPEPR